MQSPDYRTAAEYFADEAHKRRRAELWPAPEIERSPEHPNYTSRCVYCGDPEPEAHVSCCGERHFADEPECPMCGDCVDQANSSVQGIETTTWHCQSCDWISDPE